MLISTTIRMNVRNMETTKGPPLSTITAILRRWWQQEGVSLVLPRLCVVFQLHDAGSVLWDLTRNGSINHSTTCQPKGCCQETSDWSGLSPTERYGWYLCHCQCRRSCHLCACAVATFKEREREGFWFSLSRLPPCAMTLHRTCGRKDG